VLDGLLYRESSPRIRDLGDTKPYLPKGEAT
jgi:hypothetical protein